jgi:hypothetical protein
MSFLTDSAADTPSATATGWPSRLIAWAGWKHILAMLGMSALFAAALAFVQWGTPALVGTDGYYHLRMGWLIREQGLTPDFHWLPMTILNQDAFYDHHLLYHVYLAIFSTVDPLTDGGLALTQAGKIASVIMPALAFLAIWWLLRGQRVPWAAIWALGLLAVSEAFLYRMSMPRAQSASLLMLALGLHWLLKERFWPLLPLGFVYVWLYNAFPLLLGVGGVFLVATWLTERRWPWQAVLFPAAGIALGLLLNPYFPENISFIIQHLLPKIGESSTSVGNEWYPYRTWTLVLNSGFALVGLALAVLALGWQEKRIDRPALVVLLLTFLFAFMVFKSRRFVEYFPPFTLILLALSAGPLLDRWQEGRPKWRFVAPAALLLVLAGPMILTLRQARESVSGSRPADQYAQASLWLAENAPEGSLVFQTDWDDFPRLFFYNVKNIYTVGLDPTYMELHDAELFETWRDISNGQVTFAGSRIRDQFGAAFVLSDLEHTRFLSQAADDPSLQEVYRDEYAAIFAVQEQPQ